MKAYSVVNPEGKTFYLHSKEILLHNRHTLIYYFAKNIGIDWLDVLPDGMMIEFNERTGLPVVRRKR